MLKYLDTATYYYDWEVLDQLFGKNRIIIVDNSNF